MNKKKNSFEEAIKSATLWCNTWQREELSDEVLADRVSELLKTKDGARAFFAISLSSDSPLMDRIPDVLLIKLIEAGDQVVDLTVKNLAMSSAMSLTHQRAKNVDLQSGSEKVKERCIELLKRLDPKKVKKRLELLLDGIKGEGPDNLFLNHWLYDDEQRNIIAKNINLVAEN